MEKNVGLETLQVWRKAMSFAIIVTKELIPLLPIQEKWCLSSQLRRSAQSIPANIAEGHGRYYYQEDIHFCYIARGSLEEAYTQILLSEQLGYVTQIVCDKYKKDVEELRRMLNGYITFLKKSKRGEHEPGFSSIMHEDSIDYLVRNERIEVNSEQSEPENQSPD